MAQHNENVITSYWQLRNAIKYHPPKVVFFDISLFSINVVTPESDKGLQAYLHKSLDHMPLSMLKVSAVNELTDGYDLNEYLFPLAIYHNRWSTLGEADIYVTANAFMGGEDRIVHEGQAYAEWGGDEVLSRDAFDPDMLHIGDVIELCRENDIDVVFTCAPAPGMRYQSYYYPAINSKHIKTTLLACDERFKPVQLNIVERMKQKYNIPVGAKYIFSLCTLEPRKNLERVVKTFIRFIQKNNINDMYFVLGGGHWEEFIGKLEQEIENLGDYKDKLIKAGYIADEDLPSLYSGAEWFVYTSMYEGFGLPPLEAMSCGCPVITSNNTSLPEVVGDAGIMIDYDSDEQHIEAYEKYYFNPEIREEYRQKGLERAKLFSWKKCADQMLEVIKNNVKGVNDEV